MSLDFLAVYWAILGRSWGILKPLGPSWTEKDGQCGSNLVPKTERTSLKNQTENRSFFCRLYLRSLVDLLPMIGCLFVQFKIDFSKIIEAQALKTEDTSFVAELEGRVVGYMVSYILSGGFGIEMSAWIAMFGVDPKFMGKGIGMSLAEEIFEFYKGKGIKNIYTSVRWDSTDLLSFFKTLGFDRSNFINLRKTLE